MRAVHFKADQTGLRQGTCRAKRIAYVDFGHIQYCRQYTEQHNSLTKTSIFQSAVNRFATRIGLNIAEKSILEFTLQLHQERLLNDVNKC